MTTTTLTALNAGSLAYKYCVAIEGYSSLLTTAATSAAVTAWAGTDYTAALGGLFVDLQHEARAAPFAPFQGGGTCTLRIAPDSSDTFGIDTHRKLAGGETYLAATADRDDTTIAVQSTSTFAASGTAYIGTEAFSYSGVTATTFTGCTRGKYSPLDRGAGTRFAQHHRQGLQANGVTLAPIVSAQPRTWIGKWVGVYLHRDAGGVLDVKAQAQLVYFGRIIEIRDDPSTGCTVVQLKHVTDSISESVIGRDIWSAQIPEGVYIAADSDPINFPSFTFGDQQDFGGGGAVKAANNLTVVASGAVGTNQINAGYYTLAGICNAVNSWLGAESGAGRIYGVYGMESPVGVPNPTDPLRTNIQYYIPGTAGKRGWWRMTIPSAVGTMLGYEDALSSYNGRVTVTPASLEFVNSFQNWAGTQVPFTTLTYATASIGIPNQLNITNEVGTFTDQYTLLPDPPPQQLGLQWGVFLIDDRFLVVAAKNGTQLTNMFKAYGIAWPGLADFDGDFVISRTADQTNKGGPVQVRQIIIFQQSVATILKYLFYSTGTVGYNHATYDTLGYGLGLNLPGALLGTGFETSIDGLPGATDKILFIIDKPMKLADAMSSDLILRWAFPRWKAGAVTFSTWQAPQSSASSIILTESTKSAPAGNQNEHRVATTLTDAWQRDLLTIKYNRDITQPTADAYQSQLTLENRTSVDDNGGEGHTLTISARNSFATAANAGLGVEDIAPQFMSTWAMFSQPIRMQTRSISPKYYEQLAPGDVIIITDSFARDPNTGLRGIAARAALITRIKYSRGGAQPGNPKGGDAQGEVDLIFAPDGARLAPYAYGSRVDETASAGGFTAGYNSATNTLRCRDHEYSETSETKDVGNFIAGDKILIVEIDPASSAAPTMWQRTILSVASSDITLTAALSAPAFDTAKQYRVTYDHYATDTATQQLLCFQADTDGLIENLSAPDQFGSSIELLIFSSYDPSLLPELVPDVCWGDGKAYDVGHEAALIQTLNNLEDYRTAREGPSLMTAAVNAPLGTGSYTYELLDFYPVHLSTQTLSPQIARHVTVAPFFRSTTGVAVNLRVTLSRTPPRADTIDDIPRPAIYDEAIFTTSSTTFAVATEDTLSESVKDPFTGIAWVWIEGSVRCETRGLAKFTQSERS